MKKKEQINDDIDSSGPHPCWGCKWKDCENCVHG
jgi:hypothetical protein